MKKSEIDSFNERFPPFFNEWFDSHYSVEKWSNALNYWRTMKQAAYSAYVLGMNDYKEG